MLHPDDREYVVEKWRSAVATGEEFEVEARVRTATGEYREHVERIAQEAGLDARAAPLVNITAYKKADGTWGGSSSSEPHDAIVRTKSVYGNARQRYGVNRPRRTRRTSSKNQIISMY